MRGSQWIKVLHRCPGFELGEFCCVPVEEGWVRKSVALSHLIAVPRRSAVVIQEGSEPVVATPCGAVLYNAGCEYTCRVVGNECESTVFLRVEPSVLSAALEEFDARAAGREGRLLEIRHCTTAAATYLAWTAAQLGAKEPDDLAIEERLHGVLHRTLRDAYGARSEFRSLTPRQREYVRWTQEILAASFRSGWRLAEISDQVGVSAYHLCRLFRAATGMSIRAFRDSLRIRSALDELVEGDAPLCQVALKYGYAHQSHFTDAFRRHFGLTPASTRRRLGNARGWHSAEDGASARIEHDSDRFRRREM